MSEEISYKGYCFLGGAKNPALMSRFYKNGSHSYIKYFLIKY